MDVALTAIGLCLLGAACGGAFRDSPEACYAAESKGVDARFVAEVLERCDKSTGWAKCPAHDEIEAKYDAERAQARKACE
jgi:hypothetical protein